MHAVGLWYWYHIKSLTFTAQQLSITSPVDQLDILPGEDVTFSVSITLTSNVFFSLFLWNKDNVPLSDEKDSTLTIQSVDKSDAGEYFVTVVWIFSDGTSTVMHSNTALLTICKLYTGRPWSTSDLASRPGRLKLAWIWGYQWPCLHTVKMKCAEHNFFEKRAIIIICNILVCSSHLIMPRGVAARGIR